MKRLIVVLVLVLLLLPVLACDQQVAAQLLMSDKPRETSPEISEADLALLIEGNSAFAFDLYQALRCRGPWRYRRGDGRCPSIHS